MKIDKSIYAGVVKNTVKMMVLLSKEHDEYNLQDDLASYFNTSLRKEGVLNEKEYVTICKEVFDYLI